MKLFNKKIKKNFDSELYDDVKCEVIFRLMKKEKLLQDYNFINIYDDKNLNLIIKLIVKFN